VVIAMALFLVPKAVGSIAAVVFVPIHTVENWISESSASLPFFLRDRSALEAQMHRLEQELVGTLDDQSTIAGLEAENQALRSLHNATATDRVLAGVIARPNQTPYDVLILDRGSDHGIVPQAPVFAASTTVIGYTTRVFAQTSIVELITSPQVRTSVYVYGPNIYTNAEGIGGGVLRVGVPQGIPLSEGDVVVVPSVELGIFGRITTIESEPTSPEQFGYVTTEVPIQSLRLVTVSTEPITEVSFEQARSQVADTVSSLFTVEIPDDVLVDISSTSTATSSEQVIATTTDAT